MTAPKNRQPVVHVGPSALEMEDRVAAKLARPPSDSEPWVVADNTGVRVTFSNEDAAWRYRNEYTNRLVNPTVTHEPAAPPLPQAAPGSADVGAGWRPIATAPKDGTEVLAYREDWGVFIAKWDCADGLRTMTDKERDELDEESLFQPDWWGGDSEGGGHRLEGSETPTHWMPLPAAPSQPAAADPGEQTEGNLGSAVLQGVEGGAVSLTLSEAQAVFAALDIGLGAASSEAAHFHEAMKGYREVEHKRLDDDTLKVSAALTLMGQKLPARNEGSGSHANASLSADGQPSGGA